MISVLFLAPAGQPKKMTHYATPAAPPWHNIRSAAIILRFQSFFLAPAGQPKKTTQYAARPGRALRGRRAALPDGRGSHYGQLRLHTRRAGHKNTDTLRPPAAAPAGGRPDADGTLLLRHRRRLVRLRRLPGGAGGHRPCRAGCRASAMSLRTRARRTARPPRPACHIPCASRPPG